MKIKLLAGIALASIALASCDDNTSEIGSSLIDNADKLVRAGAPAKMAWGVALGLAVTLVWLYTEILRLLSYFNNR